jgi:hypothetical protein
MNYSSKTDTIIKNLEAQVIKEESLNTKIEAQEAVVKNIRKTISQLRMKVEGDIPIVESIQPEEANKDTE